LQDQVEILDANPSIDVIAGAVNLINNNGDFLSVEFPSKTGILSFDDIAKKNIVLAPTCMIRMNVFSRFGMYRNDYLYEDYYLWLKILSNNGKILIVDKIWANYRYMSGNMSNRIELYYRGMKQILSDYLPHPQIKKTLDRARLVYCVKRTLLEGSISIKHNSDELKLLNFFNQIILRLIAVLPLGVRLNIYNKLVQRF
jgi:hypothetical protein